MTQRDSASGNSADSYHTLDDEETPVPVSRPVIRSVSNEFDIDEEVLVDALTEHQRDLHSDGTVYSFALRLEEEGSCSCLTYTDAVIFLAVDEEVWTTERAWFDLDDDVFDAVVEAHTAEADCAAEEVDIERGRQFGYCIGVGYPLRSAALHSAVDGSPFEIAARAEFLERDVGIDRLGANAYATHEHVSQNTAPQCRTSECVAEILGVPEPVSTEARERVEEWSQDVEELLDGFGQTTGVTPSAFGAVAAFDSE